MFKKLIILAVLVLVSTPLFAQSVDTAWVRRYDGPGNEEDHAHSMAVDGSGNVYVTGGSMGIGTYDYATIKYYSNGDTAWVRRYTGPDYAYNEALAIVVDSSVNVYVTGYSYGNETFEDYATIKYYSNGDTAWVRRYNGPGNGYDEAWAIAVDDSGNVYVTGRIYGSGTDYDYASIKYYPNGDTAWVRRYNGPGNGFDEALAIAVDGSSNLYVTGGSDGSGTDADYAVLKYYPNGDTAWVRRYNGPGNGFDEALAIAVDGSGNVYVTGVSDGSGTDWDYATLKYYPNGDTAWVRRHNGPGNGEDAAYDIAVDGSGNVFVTGWSYGSGTDYDYASIKYYPNGDTAWVRRYNGPGNDSDEALAIAMDGSGNVYVTGYSYGSGTNYDYATIKYYPNGDTAWVRRHNGPGNGDDFAYAIAVDGHNLYVTGGDVGIGTTADYATIKYGPLHRHDTLSFIAYSPVDLIVADPLGDSIGIDFNTIPDATYDTTNDQDKVTIPDPLFGEYTVKVKREPDADTGHYSIRVKLDGNEDKPLAQNLPIPPPDQVDTYTYPVIEYLRGDANSDGKPTVSDVVFLINYLFKGGTAPDPVYLGEVNCDGKTTVSDVVYLINYLFKGGPAPCS